MLYAWLIEVLFVALAVILPMKLVFWAMVFTIGKTKETEVVPSKGRLAVAVTICVAVLAFGVYVAVLLFSNIALMLGDDLGVASAGLLAIDAIGLILLVKHGMVVARFGWMLPKWRAKFSPSGEE